MNQYEVFYNRGVPDTRQLACRVIADLGDEFDFMVFHNEFEVDSQEGGTGGGGARELECGHGRLKALMGVPVSMHMYNASRIDDAGRQIAHEFGHVWSAYLSYSKGGRREPLFENSVFDNCRCHWRIGFHTPAAFPRHGRQEGGSHMSVVFPGNESGGFWRENADGTFTPGRVHPEGSGPSWLDLYVMGLADAHEVPDMFLLRNLKPLSDDRYGAYTADKEVVTIEQIVAAEGPRVSSVSNSQKDFNAAFVYLVEPGQEPMPDLFGLHARYINALVERWFHFTGERSRITTVLASQGNRSPIVVGTLPELTLRAGGAADVDVSAAFSDPDGDALIYEATSSVPAVATVVVSGSTATVRAVAAGTATVTVTATDAGGSNTTATLAFLVTVRARATFTDDPIVPGVTPVKAVHFTELRERIDLLRTATRLEPFSWTDPVLTAGVTPVRLTHLRELRDALAELYVASGRAAPTYTDAVPMSGTTPIRTAHLMELRAAVLALQ